MSAQHEAKRTEQKARGELERQKLQNEKARIVHTHTHTHKDEFYNNGSVHLRKLKWHARLSLSYRQ